MRIALGVEYNGKNYYGWQRQHGLITVQESVEQALSKVADCPLIVHCAGRTDAGVHARSQVIHFDCEKDRKLDAWVLGANCYLPSDISILWAKKVPDDFHARFSAVAREYRYVIYNHKTRPSILNGLVTWHLTHLDEKLMQHAGQQLIGEHDFSSFRGSNCQSRTAIRKIQKFRVSRQRKLVIIEVKANAFLLHMVRNIAGLLITIGEGKNSPAWAKEILEYRDRKLAPFAASPHGLYLHKIYYPEHYCLPK